MRFKVEMQRSFQCFPDDYVFYGSRSDKNLQIGNAVPTFLSLAMKDSILQHIELELLEQGKINQRCNETQNQPQYFLDHFNINKTKLQKLGVLTPS